MVEKMRLKIVGPHAVESVVPVVELEFGEGWREVQQPLRRAERLTGTQSVPAWMLVRQRD